MKELKGKELSLNILSNALGGYGVAEIETEKGNFKILIENGLEGQIVIAKVKKIKKRHAIASIIKIVKKSNLEVNIPYQRISGAPLATLPNEIQKKIKFKETITTFKKIGAIEDLEEKYFDEFIDSPLIWNYRNKMEYTFSAIGYDLDEDKEFDGFALGFKKRGTWWCVENLNKESGLFDKELEDNLHKIRNFLYKTNLPAWHPPQKKGFFRFLVVRKSFSNNNLLIKLVTSSDSIEKFKTNEFKDFLLDLFRNRIAGIIHATNDDIGDNSQSRFGNQKLLYGNEKITEDMLGLKFSIDMESFFQTNPRCTELLYQKVVDYANYTIKAKDNTPVIMDLFCGTGTISQIIATQIKAKIIGIDIVKEAIANAKMSAISNKLKNINFFAQDAGVFLKNNPKYKNSIDTLIIDPPRGGLSKKTLKRIVELKANYIIYVSCHPGTQARDLVWFKEQSYSLTKISFVNQYPHTYHIETISLLKLK